jgi:hypothetical protein
MKSILVGILALAALLTACSTQKSVSNSQGKGTKQAFDAPFDAAWRAAVDAAQQNDLQILNADRARGYISARRSIRVETFGENVGVWVTSLGPSRTQVEVVSRQAGPPVMWLKNWENEILRAVAANLTREGVGGTGTPIETNRDTSTTVPEQTTPVGQP